MTEWFSETLHPHWRQSFAADRVLLREQTAHQDLVILENQTFGRVMVLDGMVQLTERDEFVYHEMIAHVPLFGHGAARRVLIIGGGDGGTLREVLRHKTVERATMVEIDATVVEMARDHMPMVSDGAFDDPRAELIIADGIAFVAGAHQPYDVIIIDSTDPFGPAEGLFTPAFYGACRQLLTPGGVLVVQAGVPFLQPREIAHVNAALSAAFPEVAFYAIAVPTYVGGLMTLGWASEDAGKKVPDPAVLAARVAASGLAFGYYSPEGHAGAFALPPHIRAAARG
ncbi:polyamine aminopropyltransferase [Rhodospirillum rubrum]|uniref:Polyamine aminopropyltransferase n=1 Tax=Rhodospirillum rubrum (strain ATCC 11170 / ATH 1.1.1 / DSM 467 / LMG 4362 / NCIMB 8255 / S1) TaxID=269796 RepID=Q2RTQ4_RHORT|nr:polyamine aminopropyltransferase [Rhodospirillum rubrum]ABC22491.1 spermidine synthase [Rhodospirillum rubrum ATCC 11170]AEO48209.1 spermidine synthase [Rhodospirillum rubrum F11]MBK5954079.1 spermidine synthase [Rhodospirillum rubrum]QXG82122.1 polyamine aminopropyltransferase [Rhodospirillum rubrum]HAP99524.1 polyamine aminopropyltransferase [Rhodospirillum rubrum]